MAITDVRPGAADRSAPSAAHPAEPPRPAAPVEPFWERARAAAEPGLALEIGMVRLALARLLEEETDALRFA